MSTYEIEHFGVKGMHWGVRKASSPSPGSSNASTRTPEQQRARQIRNRRIIVAGAVLAYAAIRLGPSVAHLTTAALNETAHRKMTTEGAKAAADLFANGHGLTNYKTVNLAFNGAKGLWE